ncbi:hypothetical protein DFP72DRAFT_1077929 [Ephemerocybe angulata]|uniref:F-box domain-containing protein n=1 Tax=Ephemerocybe angulata TaxID=980116 RepID=A0A8H6HDG3_9AGAR|nr:hypothetical protein DFP72DRAFT_1077929 [Tulosesus angulatus]
MSSVAALLPYDVLRDIIDEVPKPDFAILCVLRLVSKAINEIVEPKVFASTSISFTDRPYAPAQLEAMASGNSPYSQWTTSLSIRKMALLPLQVLAGDRFQGEERSQLLSCQTGFLVPALESLRKLRSVCLDVSRREPFEDVLSSLARLPNLEELRVLNCVNYEDNPLFLEKFSNLRHISLSSIYLHPSAVTTLKRMTAQSLSTLETLTLAPQQVWVPGTGVSTPVKLEDLFEESRGVSSSPSLPALNALHVTGVELAATSVHLLRSLVKLQVDTLDCGSEPLELDGVRDCFWEALESSGVRLERLAISHLTPTAVKYLTSYEGLRELLLGSLSLSISHEDHFAELRPGVLTQHRKSLKILSLAHVAEFICTERDLELICLCEQLDTLTFQVGYPESAFDSERTPTISLDALFLRIAERLPRLRQLLIYPKPGGSHFIPQTAAARSDMIFAFVKAVCEVHYADTVPRFELLGSYGYGPFEFDLGTRRFVEVKR